MRRNASAAELASSESMVAAAEERIKQVEARISQAKAQSGRADVLLSWTRNQSSFGRQNRPAPGGSRNGDFPRNAFAGDRITSTGRRYWPIFRPNSHRFCKSA